MGERLRRLREQMGLTQAELARRSGVARYLVNRYEHGKASPTVNQLDRLLEPMGFQAAARPLLNRQERRSLGFAYRVRERLLDDPEPVLVAAREQLERQRVAVPRAAAWHDTWAGLLELPVGVLADLIVDEGQFARDLRQSSPLTVVLDEAERLEVIGAT